MNPRKETIGDCEVWLGDCRDILPTLPKVDACVTDPPYGVLSESGSAATRRSGWNLDKGVMAWDVAPGHDLLQTMIRCARWSAIWGGCHLELPPTLGYLVWDKQIDGLNFGEVEYCWTNAKFAPRMFRYRAVGIDGSLNTSGYRGVTRVPRARGPDKYQASIRKNLHAHYLGMFDTPEEAHAAYVAAAKQLHGEFFASDANNVVVPRPESKPQQLTMDAI